MTYSNDAKASKRKISKIVDEIKDSMMKEKWYKWDRRDVSGEDIDLRDDFDNNESKRTCHGYSIKSSHEPESQQLSWYSCLLTA